MLDYCRQYFSHYKTHLTAINKYAKTYRSIQATCWYTKDTFIHRIINQVLRTGNIEQCSLLRFYITDLSEQLYQLKCEQQKNIVESETNIVLYRGLRQSEMHLETLQNLVGHVILTKGFMSTSRNKKIALCYAGSYHSQSLQSQPLLIEIQVDMTAPDIIAADIAHLSNFPEEQKVLFGIGGQFRVESLMYDSLNLIRHCLLVAISSKSPVIQLSQHISSDESCIEIGTYNEDDAKLERIMRRDRREKFNLINNNHEINSLWHKVPSVSWIANNSSDRARILQQKALIHWQRNSNLHQFRSECKHAWELFQQRINVGASEHFRAQTLRNLGLAYTDLGDYENALASLNQALVIGLQARPTTQWSTSITLRNFGYFYHVRGDYIQATKYLSNALETFRRCAILCTEYSKV